ncbi:hypothetical protein [Mesorhizobium sp.]|uniref:hypothetical protein n=1 Tax=Mesorhizobium sp. TaxID=1871066 RepID=UPI000FE4BE35|nr:hypothetical protein [Mesorhizobium sp.]RWI83717.1 MAG: hypothetical protein EOR20_19865 [Mesorhizobium sp.]
MTKDSASSSANGDQVASFAAARCVADIYSGTAVPAHTELTPAAAGRQAAPTCSSRRQETVCRLSSVPVVRTGFDVTHLTAAKLERVIDLVLGPRPDGKLDATFFGTPRAETSPRRHANNAQG